MLTIHRAALLLLTALLAACAASNLEERPAWAHDFESWARSGGVDGPDSPPAVFDRFDEEAHLFAVGEGRAPTGQPAASEDRAVKDGLRQISNILSVRVEDEYQSTTSYTRDGDATHLAESVVDDVRTTSRSVLSEAQPVRTWHGFDGGQDVAYVLVAVNKAASADNLRALLGQELASAEVTAGELDAAVAAGALDGLPARVAALHEASERITAHLLALRVLDERASSRTEAERADALEATLTAHRNRLRSMTPTTTGPTTFVRGSSEGRLELSLSLPVGGGVQPLAGCPVRYERPDKRGLIQRVHADARGRVTLSVPIDNRTPVGARTLEATFDLCGVHTDALARDECLTCELQREHVWQVAYSVVHDAEAYAATLADAEAAVAAGKLKQAKTLYGQAQALVFDLPAESARCQARVAALAVEVQVEDAEGFVQLDKYGQALEQFVAASSAAAALPDGELRALQIAQRGVEVGAEYGARQRATGDRDSRERCLTRLVAAESRWDDPGLRAEVAGIKRLLPCHECGKSARCQACRSSSLPGTVVVTCRTCSGAGHVPVDCAGCDGGFVPCTQCDVASGWKPCPKCKGKWNPKHQKCDGAGCNKCNQKGTVPCAKCTVCKLHDAKFDTCVKPGFRPLPCSVCGGHGVLEHPGCESGPADFGGVEWRGYQLQTCPTCEGTRSERVACPEGCDDGVCTTCGGVGHRV